MVEIWTDGACKGNPGPGGWGVLMHYKGHKKELYGGEYHTTNNRMELLAVIQALETLNRPCQITLYIDSQYVKNGILEWMPKWLANQWRTSNKKPVKNQDLWQRLNQALERHEVQWQWVKGHSTNMGNQRADELANQGCQQIITESAK